MKKLMIAAAIVCAAVVANAAAVTWSTGKLRGPNNAANGDGSVVSTSPVLNTIGSSMWEITMKLYAEDTTTLVATDSVVMSVDGEGNVSFASAKSGGTAGKSAVGGTASWSATTGISVKTDTATLGLDANTDYFMVLSAVGNIGDISPITKESSQIAVATKGASSASTFKGGDSTAWTGGTWSVPTPEPPDPTPEPTSGLLMLVGLAGLALRRKQA